jgi:hypothetical protein
MSRSVLQRARTVKEIAVALDTLVEHGFVVSWQRVDGRYWIDTSGTDGPYSQRQVSAWIDVLRRWEPEATSGDASTHPALAVGVSPRADAIWADCPATPLANRSPRSVGIPAAPSRGPEASMTRHSPSRISKCWRRHPRWRAFWWGFFHPIHRHEDREAHCRMIVREAYDA